MRWGVERDGLRKPEEEQQEKQKERCRQETAGENMTDAHCSGPRGSRWVEGSALCERASAPGKRDGSSVSLF